MLLRKRKCLLRETWYLKLVYTFRISIRISIIFLFLKKLDITYLIFLVGKVLGFFKIKFS